MHKVRSKDGTSIAYTKDGTGPAVIAITGALGVGSEPMFTELAELLAPHFTAITYHRRGRGQSGDTQPYAVEREIEDIEAIIEAVGGSASLYGLSSGAALALETANKVPAKVKKAALYEPPYVVDDSHPPLPADYIPHLKQLIAEGRRGDAVEYFMTAAIGLPEEYLAPMRADPSWASMKDVAHTLHYDGTIMGQNMAGKPFRPNQWPNATMPILVITGGESDPFFFSGADALVSQLPKGKRHILPGQSHGVESAVLAPLLIDFFR
jgi:pimeloyl-ACP methyl ester carboxylesterase